MARPRKDISIEKLERFDKQLDLIAEGYRAQALSDTTKIT